MSEVREFYGHALPGLEPLDRDFGGSRGQPIDRWYIDRFLSKHRADAVLAHALHLTFDVRAAISAAHADLPPGGVLLATLPGISQIDRREPGDHWRFTAKSARRLFGEAFGEENVDVEVYGNVLVASAFLYGYARDDLTEDELAVRDSQFPFLIGVRATRVSIS